MEGLIFCSTICFSMLLYFDFAAEAYGGNIESEIIEGLLRKSNPRAFPQPGREAVQVNISFFILQIQSLDEKEQTLTTSGSLLMEWFDDNLIWTNESFKRDYVELGPEDIWRPLVIVPNSINEIEDITNSKSTVVRCNKGTGRIDIQAFKKFTTYCAMNMKYFPFDRHKCQITFIHPLRFGLQSQKSDEKPGIHFHTSFPNPTLQLLQENGEWDILNLTLDTSNWSISMYQIINVTYPQFIINFDLKRKSNFYTMILILPSILVSLISLIGFLLPSEAGEKVSLQLSALLSYVLLLLVLVDIIPPRGGNFPLVATVLVAGQIISTINLLITVLNLRLFHHEPKSKLPHGLRKVVFGITAPVVFVKTKPSKLSFKRVATEPIVNAKGDGETPEEPNDVKVPTMETDQETHLSEWQIMARVIDNTLFLVNLLVMPTILSYFYVKLLTYQGETPSDGIGYFAID